MLSSPVECFRIAQDQPAAKPKLYNTAKKLLDGKQVFSFTQSRFDIADYCEHAKHYDYTWFDMQHSTLEFKDIAEDDRGLPSCRSDSDGAEPDAQEWHIQHTTDIGCLGVIIATVDYATRLAKRPSGRAILRSRAGVRGPDRRHRSGYQRD